MDVTDFTIQHRWFVVPGLSRPLRTQNTFCLRPNMPSSREMRELGMEVTGQQCADGS
jgi:hypothetical protein